MSEAFNQAAIVTGSPHLSREEEILARCRAGDWSGYGDIVNRYRRLVWAAVDAVLPADDYTADVVQEVFIRAYEKLHTFRGQSSFSSWLYRLARNHALSHVRWHSRRPRTSSIDAEPDSGTGIRDRITGGGNPDAEYAGEARLKALSGMLRRLSREYREVINLYYQEELSYESIADLLGLPLNTVKTRLRRARMRLSELAQMEGWQ